MARYYLHLYNRIGSALDDEGTEARDLEAARTIAIRSVRDILGEEIRKGRIDLFGRIEIADEEGSILAVVPFADAVELRLGE